MTGRFQESNVFQELFEEIVARCVAAGLVKGEHMSVDGSFIQAIARLRSEPIVDETAIMQQLPVRSIYQGEEPNKNPRSRRD